MASGQLNGVIQNLRRSALMSDEGGLTDAQLLDAFILHAEEAAFEALVRRHAPMVWGVCLRVLGHSHDAEDAFQATFLVLVRKAELIWPRAMVGNWLYGVAYRTALKAKGAAAKRKAREKQVDEMPAQEGHDEKVWSDLKPLLDRELNRLSDKYRVPVVLCDLEGKSQREAARQLGWPEGTLMTRLARARQMLAKRLTKQGIALSVGALALALSQNAVSAGAPAPLVTSTIKAAALIAAGQAATVATTASVATLTEGVIQAMFLTKVKCAVMIVLAVALLSTGAGVGIHQVLAGRAAGPQQAPIVQNDLGDDFANEFTFFQERVADGGRDGGRKPAGASLTGKIVAVAGDGKSFAIETPPAARGEAVGRHEVKINDKTKLTFSAVGPGGAKIKEGYLAQIGLVEGSKDTAATANFMGKDRTNREPDFQGKVARVSKDGSTLTFEFPPAERGGAFITKDIKITSKTTLTYSGVTKGGTTPTEGYAAGVWFVKGSKDTADSIHFHAGKGPERGTVAAKADSAGIVAVVSKDGKTVSLTAKIRGDVIDFLGFKIDDKTQIHFNNVGPNGDKVTVGYQALVWLADGSKDTAKLLILQGPTKERHTVLHGQVVGGRSDGKAFKIEVPGKARGEEGRKLDVHITDQTRVIYMNVGLDGARLGPAYSAEVTLEDGSETNAAQVIFSGARGEIGRR